MMLAIICSPCNLSKSSADIEPTPRRGLRDEVISSFCDIVYLHDVKCAVY